MKKIVVYVETRKVGSRSETEFEFEEGDESEIEELAREAMYQMIEWGWEVSEE